MFLFCKYIHKLYIEKIQTQYKQKCLYCAGIEPVRYSAINEISVHSAKSATKKIDKYRLIEMFHLNISYF
jgi:hypothetical protein